MDNYDEIADMYDLIYVGDFDIDFYEREAKEANGPVLEVGCGTGRVLLELLKKGIDIEGIDISKEMLRILKNKAKIRGLSPHVYYADMRDFSLKRRYGMIIIPYRTFLHLSTDVDRLATLKNIYKHLLPGGKVIIHVYNPSQPELETTNEFKPVDITKFRIGQDEITVLWYMRYSKPANEAKYLIVLYKGKKKIREFSMTLHFINYKKARALLKKAGFKNIMAYVDFTKRPYRSDEFGKEILWVARK
ncbi:MAG: methyltransferase domain-containing protein [Candidatus Bilamarchaeaceae archaeon]